LQHRLLLAQQIVVRLAEGMPCAAARASICCCTSGVSTQPGQIALQVTPWFAASIAMTLVSPTSPCLAVT
jgi:hypothetical protein